MTEPMTLEELGKAIDALYAYDTRCTDSGTHDPHLKARVREQLTEGGQLLMWQVLLSLNVTNEHRREGYGWEDLAETAEWIERLIDIEFDSDAITLAARDNSTLFGHAAGDGLDVEREQARVAVGLLRRILTFHAFEGTHPDGIALAFHGDAVVTGDEADLFVALTRRGK